MSTITSTQATTSPTMLPGISAPPGRSGALRFSVAQYERMGDAGILTEDDRVELVEGLIYRKPMKKGPHSITCRETAAALSRIVPAATHFVTREDPVNIPELGQHAGTGHLGGAGPVPRLFRTAQGRRHLTGRRGAANKGTAGL